MKKYIYSLIAVVAAFTLTAQTTIDRSSAPTPGPARVPTIASYESFELKNGLKVFVVEDHKFPRISMSLILDRDPIVEGDKAGYVSIAGDLLGAGTANRTKAELDEEVDFMGARFSTSASSMNVGGLSKYTDNLIEIMADVLLNPSFPAEEFDKLKSQMTSGLKANAEVDTPMQAVIRESSSTAFADKAHFVEAFEQGELVQPQFVAQKLLEVFVSKTEIPVIFSTSNV